MVIRDSLYTYLNDAHTSGLAMAARPCCCHMPSCSACRLAVLGNSCDVPLSTTICASCMCYMPFCQRCQEQLGRSEVAPPSWLRSESSGGSGHSLTPSENLRISTLHTQLQLQLDGAGDHLQFIQKGSGWNSLPCSKSTRLVHAVSQLSGCGIYQVLNALEKKAASDACGTTRLIPALKRGRVHGTTRLSPARKRCRVAGIVESTISSDVDSTKHGADASHRGLLGRSETDVAMAVATGAIGAESGHTQVHGVRGNFFFFRHQTAQNRSPSRSYLGEHLSLVSFTHCPIAFLKDWSPRWRWRTSRLGRS